MQYISKENSILTREYLLLRNDRDDICERTLAIGRYTWLKRNFCREC